MTHWYVRLRAIEPIGDERWVTIHGSHVDPSPEFPALLADERWNGWVVPRFRHEVAKLVVDWVTEWNDVSADPKAQDRLYWNDDDDTVVHHYSNRYPAETELYEPDVDDYYPIGAMTWTWTEVR